MKLLPEKMGDILENKKAFSVCIPIYNCNVFELVSELHRQAISTGCPFEILLIDDLSSTCISENRRTQEFSNVSYVELKENIGRAKIRNLLAKKAQYPYLIFMDCDTEVDNPLYLQNYLNEIPADVVVGGYQYTSTPPEREYLLRWRYGICREQRSALQRSERPNKSFSTFNFMIRKEIVEKIPLNEDISGYGHEDTLFGWTLREQHIVVKHIDNTIIHKMLDDAGTFIEKTENSVQNLWKIYQSISQKEEFVKDNDLLRCYVALRRNHLSGVVSLFFKIFRSLLYRNLLSKRPWIRFFDLYKLGIINEAAK
jgi:glycosyltransferase involved in cell wall biosynthesis